MLRLSEPEHIASIPDPDLRHLLHCRRHQLGTLEGLVVVESGDSPETLESVSGLPILKSLFDAAVAYPDEDYVPAFEVIEDHGCCYEMVFILSDDDAGTALFIPKSSGLDPVLLSLCAEFCVQVDSDP